MKKQNGITLIALVITIIVMMILVAVSVTVALRGELFSTAQKSSTKTQAELEKERLLSLVLGTLGNDRKVNFEKLDEAIEGTEFTGIDGVYRSTKTGKKYIVSESGNVIEKLSVAILPAKSTYTVGEEVTIGSEHFYVIKDATDKVTLLSKYNLNADGLQDTTGETNPCAFSAASNYAGVDLNNNATLRADTTSALYKAIQYGARFEIDGVEGRLMTLGEVKELGGNDYSTEGCNTNGYGFVSSVDGKSLNYWLATDFNGGGYLYSVHGSSLAGDWYDGEDYGAYSGVRPVIEIPKSLIDIEKVTIALRKLAYTIGEEVTIGKEHFYVIADNQEQLTLLAKYNLKADGKQDTSGAVNACAFSTVGGFTTSDLNKNATVKADTTSAVYKAMQYGEKIEETYEVDGITGRLMTIYDLQPLGLTINENDDFGSTADCNTNGYSFVNSTDKGAISYWLGEASFISSGYYVLAVSGNSNRNNKRHA